MVTSLAHHSGRARAIVTLTFLLGHLVSVGQGIIEFSNSGDNIDAPVSGPEGLLGVGYFAQLQTADGTDVGEPAPFVADGLFSGGHRIIPKVPAGQSVTLQISIFALNKAITGTTDLFNVTLGTSDVPGTLTSLKPYNIPKPRDIYRWTNPFGFPGSLAGLDDYFCRWVAREGLGAEFTAIIPVDDCFCAGLPFPGRPKRDPAPCDQQETETAPAELRITYTRNPDGTLELRWPASTTLYRSTNVDDREDKIALDPSVTTDNENVGTIPTTKDHQFFWLE